MIVRQRVLLASILAACAAGAAHAEPPSLIGTYREWSAFKGNSEKNQVCYAMAKPSATLPKKATRDPIYFMVSDWPARRAKGELEVVPGYPYKEGSSVTAEVGNEKYELFTRNEGGGGSAWVEDLDKEQHLLEAMKKGSTMTVTGVSQRGTTTHDTYKLTGLTEALEKANAACGM